MLHFLQLWKVAYILYDKLNKFVPIFSTRSKPKVLDLNTTTFRQTYQLYKTFQTNPEPRIFHIILTFSELYERSQSQRLIKHRRVGHVAQPFVKNVVAT